MSNSPEPQQIFVRNDKGRLWGPVTPQTLELLLENKLIEGRIQISTDGLNFAFPSRFPELREFVPRELWGDGPAPSAAPNAPVAAPAPRAAAPNVIAPPPPPELTPAASTVPGPPPVIAGPGAARPSTPAAAPVAGPGARQPPVLRAGPGAMAAQQARVAAAVRPASGGVAATRPDGVPMGAAVGAPVAAPVSARPAAPSRAATPAPAPAAAVAEDGPPARGELTKVSAIRLYYLAASSDQTGLLSLHLGDRTIEIHFRKGNPEYVGSNHPEDALPGFLLNERLATPEQIGQAEAALEKFGGDLIAALFGTGILNPATAFAHLAQRAQGLLMKALLAFNGTFEFAPKELPSHKAMPLGNRWALLMEFVRRVPILGIKRRLADVADNPVMKSGGRVALADLRLTSQETRATAFIDGVRSLNQLARDMPQDGDVFFRLAWALREMDVVSFAAVKLPVGPAPEAAAPAPADAAPQPAPAASAQPAAAPQTAAASRTTPPAGSTVAAKPRAPAPAPAASAPRPAAPPSPRPAPAAPTPPRAHAAPAPAAPAAPVDYDAEVKTLRAAHEKLKDQNKFEVLGLTDKADASAVKLAYFKLAKLYHPDTVPPDAPAEVEKLKADIFAAVGDAYRTLSDDAARASYIEDLKAGGGGDIDVAKILHAEELFQKGSIMVKAKKFPEAVEMLTDAIAMNPDEGEFYAWRGIARFYANADKKAGSAEADRDFALALKKNPRCSQAYFFQGQMARLLGDSKRALQQFQKTLDLQPDHLDAQREIRYLKK